MLPPPASQPEIPRHKGKMTTIDDFFGPFLNENPVKSKGYGVLGERK